MESATSIAGLERAIVRHCSPTLAGIKPACVFNMPGDFVGDPTMPNGASPREALRSRHELEASVRRVRGALVPSGVRVQVIAWRPCGALVFVHRPNQLAATLRNPRVAERLAEYGYEVDGIRWLERAIRRLGIRLERCHRRDPVAPFPHELGFFLGYPFDDVVGFIEHEGRDFLCCGCWKVYAEPERAQESFKRMRQCTRSCQELLAQGMGVGQITRIVTRRRRLAA